MPTIALPGDLARTAARQHGVLTSSQLLLGSVSRRQLRYRVEHGLLIPLIGDTTFLVAGAPLTPIARYHGATLAVDGALLSGRASAHLQSFPKYGPVAPEVLVGLTAGHLTPGVEVKRRSDVLDRHRCLVEGIPCTTIPRTVLDLAATSSVAELGTLVDALTKANRLSVRLLFDEFDRIARRGRNGTRVLRLVLLPRLDSDLISRSELEQRGLAFLARNGFPTPEIEFKPPWAGPEVGRVDVAYPEIKLVIEFDGRRWHDRSDRFENDRLRDQIAVSKGWAVVRITWRQLHTDGRGLVSRLRETVENRTVGAT